MIVSDSIILATLSRSITAQFIAVGSCYGITSWTVTSAKIKAAIWNSLLSLSRFYDEFIVLSLSLHSFAVLGSRPRKSLFTFVRGN